MSDIRTAIRIVVAARKGGVGKSSIAAGLASLLAADGKRVLVVDLDPQSNIAFMLGGDPTAPGTAALLDGGAPAPVEISERLHVLPGGPELARQDIARLDPEDLADALEEGPYDYDAYVFDAPPGSEHLERLGVVAARQALVITDAHPIAVVGVGRVLEDLEVRRRRDRKGPDAWALVLNRIDVRRSLDRNVEALLGDLGGDIPRFPVRQDTSLSMATAHGEPLASFAPRSPAAEALSRIKEWCVGQA